jgi:hypothetical protein
MVSNEAPAKPRLSPTLIVTAAILLLVAVAGAFYLTRPTSPAAPASATADAKAYVRQLELSEVTMSASESFMNQQLVEVQGKITNRGDRSLRNVEVFCLFYSPGGQEIHRERTTVVGTKGQSLTPGQTQTFRLPFDALPDGWNQAVPRMVIANISFAQ